MTDNQRKRFYFPEWSASARARGWTSKFPVHQALFSPDIAWPASPLGRELIAKVYATAQQLALRHIAPLDALRHACHIVALGKNKSSKDLDNDDTQRVVDLFRVLRDPDNLKFVAHWLDPNLSKKENLIAAVKHKAPVAYWSKIAGDKFGTSHLEDLTIYQLNQLCFTLNQRRASWGAKAQGGAGRSAPAAPNGLQAATTRPATIPSSGAFPKLHYIKKSNAPF
jgi:hypothetical protein